MFTFQNTPENDVCEVFNTFINLSLPSVIWQPQAKQPITEFNKSYEYKHKTVVVKHHNNIMCKKCTGELKHHSLDASYIKQTISHTDSS